MLHLTALVFALAIYAQPLLPTDDPGSLAAKESLAGKESLSPPLVLDLPTEEYRLALLELAFEAVSAMPSVPHAKNRARAQEKVFTAALELHQPSRALSFAMHIDNWRRGTSLAEYALYCARAGDRAQAVRYLERASRLAEAPVAPDEQEWRADRIRAKVARGYWYLGQVELGMANESGLSESALRELAETRASNLREGELESFMVQLDQELKMMDFDRMRGAMDVIVQLFDRFYHDVELRDVLESKLKDMWNRLPARVALELIQSLIESALTHDDPPKALELLEEALYIFEGGRWLVEDRITMQAWMGELRFRAGDERRARLELDSALAMYMSNPEAIVNIYRSDALRPLADAYHAIGDAARAREIYRLALEVGFVNPNGWPRSEDLAETLSSMAVSGFEPDEELWDRIHELHGSLGAPW